MENISKYETHRDQLLKALEIGKNQINKSLLLDTEWRSRHLNHINLIQQMLENPNKEHKNIRSLKYLEDGFFTYWNEAQGEEIDTFWKELEKSGLGFKRKNKLKQILDNGKIKNDHEYNYLTDIIIIALQEGKINEEQYKLLSKYIGDYEIKVNKKRN